jgi:cell division protein FtsZ
MKKSIKTANINRRDMLKRLAVISAATLLPDALLSVTNYAPAFHFIGLGDAGSNVVEYIYSKGIKGKYTCISNTIKNNLPKKIQCIQLNTQSVATEIPDAVLKIFNANDTFILLSGLGGYVGTFMTEKLTLRLHQQQKKFMTITTLPFKFEGEERLLRALATVEKLKNIPDFKFFELETIRTQYGHLPIRAAFEKVNEQFYTMYKSTCRFN